MRITIKNILDDEDVDTLCDSEDVIEMIDETVKECQEDEEDYDTSKNNKNDCCTYKFISPSKITENEKPLENVVGHENQKKELLYVIDWFKHSQELTEKGISIPKGVILFGEPGNGKSLMIKEIIKCSNSPVFVFQGKENNIVAGVYETFKKAREVGHSIIVFDELDLLINKDRRVVRALQENLDGVESSDDILVLAATNNINDIPNALLRNGRLEKLISIPCPQGEEALELFKKTYFSFNLKLPEDLDDDEVELTLNGISCVGIKAIVNDIVLRNGFENITSDMIFNSIYNITDRVKDTPEEDNLEIAIHEAGHAIVAMSFPQYFKVNRLNISGANGEFLVKQIEDEFWPYDKVIADIKISIAGILSQKIICGRGSRGCTDDLERARVDAYNLFTVSGYSSCWEKLPPSYERNVRTETFIKRRKMERKIEKLLRKCEKETSKYIKAHQKEIKTLGNLLFKKKHLKSSEILACVNGY